MNEHIAAWDSAQYLQAEEDIAGYLQAVADENCDDPAFIAHALGVVARARCMMSQLSRDTGVSSERLEQALSQNGNPRLSTVLQAVRALGLRMVFEPLPS